MQNFNSIDLLVSERINVILICKFQNVAWALRLKVCSNANPLHYYALRVPHKVNRWR